MRKQILFIFLMYISIFKVGAQTLIKDSLGDWIWKEEGPAIDTSDEIVTFCELMPEFDGGHELMHKFIKENLNYPEDARRNKIEGRVVLQFVVNRDGSLSQIEVLKSLGFGLDEEAIRLIKLMPNWKPGRQNGNLVRVKYTLPMVFKLK